MLKTIVCAGFGGQGVLTAGLLLAFAGFRSGYKVTWYPSYGSEMRGGTANCTVKISDEEIASPYADAIDLLLTFNEPAIDKFESLLALGGTLFVNSSLVPPEKSFREGVSVYKVDCDALAARAGNPKGGNIVMIGAALRTLNLFAYAEYEEYMRLYFSGKGKEKFHGQNSSALRAGFESV